MLFHFLFLLVQTNAVTVIMNDNVYGTMAAVARVTNSFVGETCTLALTTELGDILKEILFVVLMFFSSFFLSKCFRTVLSAFIAVSTFSIVLC